MTDNVAVPVAETPAVQGVDKKAEREQLTGLLKEARSTRDVLVDGRAAIESGTFNGHKMLALAKFLAFVEAILHQNAAHISNLTERLEGK